MLILLVLFIKHTVILLISIKVRIIITVSNNYYNYTKFTNICI